MIVKLFIKKLITIFQKINAIAEGAIKMDPLPLWIVTRTNILAFLNIWDSLRPKFYHQNFVVTVPKYKTILKCGKHKMV
jgi:hypothetical protein